MSRLSWWLISDAGLLARIVIGASFFLTLAAIDLIRHGSRATRWREYAFLLAATAFAMLYGVANDSLAAHISWEYFYYGKEASAQLGPAVPPDPQALYRAAIGIGLRATWTAGLLIGAVLLIANNPKPNRYPMPYHALIRLLLYIGGLAALGAVAGSIVGSFGLLNWTNAELRAIWQDNQFRPQHFLAVYGLNLGGYVGGIVGCVWAVLQIRKYRRDNAEPCPTVA